MMVILCKRKYTIYLSNIIFLTICFIFSQCTETWKAQAIESSIKEKHLNTQKWSFTVQSAETNYIARRLPLTSFLLV
jgi:hypothetical protein